MTKEEERDILRKELTEIFTKGGTIPGFHSETLYLLLDYILNNYNRIKEGQ